MPNNDYMQALKAMGILGLNEAKREASGAKNLLFGNRDSSHDQADTVKLFQNIGKPKTEAFDTANQRQADRNTNMVAGIFGGPEATGWEQAEGKFSNLSDKMPRFEINDNPSKFNWDNYQKLYSSVMPQKLTSVLDHPELYKQYPEMENVFVSANSKKPMGAETNLKNKTIRFGEVNDDPHGTLLHEVQHLIQDKEGFAGGGTPEKAGSYEAYRNMPGEIEASDVSNRRNLNKEQRLSIQPGSSSNVSLADRLKYILGR